MARNAEMADEEDSDLVQSVASVYAKRSAKRSTMRSISIGHTCGVLE